MEIDLGISTATSDEETRLLIICAMLPPPISLNVIVDVTGLSPVKALQYLDGLVSKDLLCLSKQKGPGYYQLKRPKKARKILDRGHADFVVEIADELIGRIDQSGLESLNKNLIIANILSMTGTRANEVEHLMRAAKYCLDKGAFEAATTYFHIILSNLPIEFPSVTSKQTYIDAALGVISSHGHLTPLAQQRRILVQALGFANDLGDEKCLCRVSLRLAQVAKTEGNYEECARLNQEAWDLAKTLKEKDLLKEAALFTADFLFWQGSVSDAIARYEEVLGDLEKFPSDQSTLRACATFGWCYGICGQISRGVSLLKAVRSKAKAKGYSQVIIYSNLMSVLALLEARRTKDAEPYLNEILKYPEEELGNYILWGSYACKAFMLYTHGDLQGCFEYQKKAYDKSKEMGWFHHRGPWNFDYIDALEEAGLIHPEMNYESEIERLRNWPDIYMQGVGLRYRAQRMLKKGGAKDEIIVCLQESLRLLSRAGAKLELARTQLLLARMDLGAKKVEKASALLKEAWIVLSEVNPKLFPDELQSYIDEEPKENYLFDTLIEVSKAIGLVRDRNRLLERIMVLLLKLTRAGRGGFFLMRPNDQPELVAGRNLDMDIMESPEFKAALGMIFQVIKTGKEVMNHSENQNGNSASVQRVGWELSYPVMLGKKLLGVIYLDNTLVGLAPLDNCLSVLQVIANQLAVSLDNAKAYEEIAYLKDRLEEETHFYRMEMDPLPGKRNIIGKSKAIQGVLKQIKKISSTDTSVLISGETGVGKEPVARAIHRTGKRSEESFIPVNTASLDPGVVASELFGHEKGAFTGAVRMRRGRFELANHGTLFMDDIDTLSLEIQAKILRALQEKEFERVGGDKTIKSDFRLITATNQDLEWMVKKGRFRADLYYRLKVFPIHIPPLRERKEDIPLLAAFFLEHYNAKLNKKIAGLTNANLEKLTNYTWPGNIRELKHIIERAVILSETKKLVLPDLGRGSQVDLESEELLPLEEMERRYILKVLEHCNWKVSGKGGAAEKLDIKPTTLYARMRKLGLRKNLTYTPKT